MSERLHTKAFQIVFSPTGGTGRVADIITGAWEMSVSRIDLSCAGTDYSSYDFERDDIAVIAAIAAVAEHSIMHQYASGRPDAEDEMELRRFAGQIQEKIRGGLTETSTPQIPGNRPYKKAGGSGLVPKADNNCTNCGLCAERCPVRAISRDHLKTADSKKCISCMRCIALCPQRARKVNGAVVSAAALAMKKVCSVRKGNELFI